MENDTTWMVCSLSKHVVSVTLHGLLCDRGPPILQPSLASFPMEAGLIRKVSQLWGKPTMHASGLEADGASFQLPALCPQETRSPGSWW